MKLLFATVIILPFSELLCQHIFGLVLLFAMLQTKSFDVFWSLDFVNNFCRFDNNVSFANGRRCANEWGRTTKKCDVC